MRLWLWMPMAVDEVWLKEAIGTRSAGLRHKSQDTDVPDHGMCWSAWRSNGFTQFTPVFQG